jgi:hypothetical protein
MYARSAMLQTLQEVGQYLGEVKRHLGPIVTGSLIVGLRPAFGRLFPAKEYLWNSLMPIWLVWTVLVSALAVAQFLAWRDKQREVERLRSASLIDFADELLLGPTSNLSPEKRVLEAQRQYEDRLERCRRSKTEDRKLLAAAARRHLEILRGYSGSGPQYAAEVDAVQRALRQLAE